MIRALSFLFVLVFAAAGCGGSDGGGGGGGGGTQTKRLMVTNSCSYPIWIQHTNGASGSSQSYQIASGHDLELDIPDAGRASDRFWPKKDCDSTGDNCSIGQSSDPCPSGGCPPPIDSKLEVTWGCTLADQSGCGVTPQGDRLADTYWNMSAVDGYTFPFTATISGNTRTDAGQACVEANCAAMSLSQCPTADDLSQGRTAVHPQYAASNLEVMSGGVQIGCYSPCKKLNYPTFGGDNLDENSDEAIMYCCPAGVTPEECSAGPVVNTQYVAAVRSMCNRSVYSYAYDDGNGLRQCSAGTMIHVTFGPNCP